MTLLPAGYDLSTYDAEPAWMRSMSATAPQPSWPDRWGVGDIVVEIPAQLWLAKQRKIGTTRPPNPT